MKTLLFVITLLILISIEVMAYLKEYRLLKIILKAMIIFTVEYVGISSIFLALNRFNLNHVILVCGGLVFVAILPKIKDIQKSVKKIEFDIGKEGLQLCLLAIVLIFAANKSEDIRSTSDMGIYFERANALISSDTSNVHTIDEYGKISDNVDEGLHRLQSELIGLYEMESDNEEVYYFEYHALPTWPSIMALFGRIFGPLNVAWALTWCYIIAIMSMFFLIENLASNRINKYLSIFLFAMSPLILYLSKTTLSEMSFLMIFCSGLFLLSENKYKNTFIGGITLGVLGYIHISVYMYIPILFAVLFWISFEYKRRDIAVANIIQCILYAISCLYTNNVSSIYSAAQLSRFGKTISTNQVICGLVILSCIFIIIQGVGMAIYKNEDLHKKLAKAIDCFAEKVISLILVAIGIGTVYKGYKLGFTDTCLTGDGSWALRRLYAGNGFSSLAHLNVVSIFMATSIVCIPLAIFWWCWSKKKTTVEKAVFLSMLYAWFIYTFIQIDTPSNYYASRYFVPCLVPMCFLLIALIVKKKKQTIYLMIVVTILAIPFNILHLKTNAFGGQKELYEDVLAEIPSGSVIFIPEGTNKINSILTNNLRMMNQNKVYNLADYDEVKNYYGDVNYYIISEWPVTEYANLEIVMLQKYDVYGNISSGGIMYPVTLNPEGQVSCFIYKQ